MAELRHVLKPSDLTDDERAWIVDRAIALKKADPDPVPNRLRVGGLIGSAYVRNQAAGVANGRYQRLYVTGKVSSDPYQGGGAFGGVAKAIDSGYTSPDPVYQDAIFYNTETTGQTSDQSGSPLVFGLYTTAMKDKTTYDSKNFDFTNGTGVWKMVSGQYPKLSWEQ